MSRESLRKLGGGEENWTKTGQHQGIDESNSWHEQLGEVIKSEPQWPLRSL